MALALLATFTAAQNKKIGFDLTNAPYIRIAFGTFERIIISIHKMNIRRT
jgi:hypothetical protein